MRYADKLITCSFGLISNRYKSINEWLIEYRKIINSKGLNSKTIINKLSVLKHLIDEIGLKPISSIKPAHIAKIATSITAAGHPQEAKRFICESRDFFNEAIIYGWIQVNPAISLKPPKVRTLRHRLSIDEFNKIYVWSIENQPPWVHRMMLLALVSGQRRSDIAEMKFSDVMDSKLIVNQQKTNVTVVIPLNLKLAVIDKSLSDVIEYCKSYAQNSSDHMIRKHNGDKLGYASLSARFEEARNATLTNQANPASLHECRSLSERLYRIQGINTRILLGHKHQSMTDVYNDERTGLSQQVMELKIP